MGGVRSAGATRRAERVGCTAARSTATAGGAAAGTGAGGAHWLQAAQITLSDILEQFAGCILLLLIVVVVRGAALSGKLEESARGQRRGFVREMRNCILIDAIVAYLRRKQRSLLL